MGYRFNLSIIGLICVTAYLAFHYRHLYLDYLPVSLSSRLRYYAPLSTFEDAAEQGEPLVPALDVRDRSTRPSLESQTPTHSESTSLLSWLET